jgi:hypothetical protein
LAEKKGWLLMPQPCFVRLIFNILLYNLQIIS